jgi:sugar O-acyltransferase (sialic acid O-acetyltransferase NeuD family)
MRDLLLVAASGLAREALAVVRTTRSHAVLGLLDDAPERWGDSVDGLTVLGGMEEVKDHPDAQVLLCVGSGAARHRLADRLAAMGVDEDRYATVIHPSVDVPRGCIVGPGSVLLAQVALTTAVRVGRHVVAMPNVTLTHDNVVGDFATLCAGVTLGGEVVVGEGAYLGMNASVRERLTVGPFATLGMGAVLLADLPPGQVWTGVPARPQLRAAGRGPGP